MSIQFDHALVALDQSEASDIIVDCLNHFEKFGTKTFTLFTSVSISYPGGLGSDDEAAYKNKLEEYSQKIKALGFVVRTDVRANINAYAPSQIMKAAKDHNVDYIIIANRGHNKLREYLLGSTATELLQRCHLPVYLINLTVSDDHEIEDRKLYCTKACRDSLDHILYPTDFSDTAMRAYETIKNITEGTSGDLTIVHVQATGRMGMTDPETVTKFDNVDTDRLEKMKIDLRKTVKGKVQFKIEHGSPAKEILKVAESEGASMIIMGSQGRGYVNDLFLGGVSYQVIRRSNIPVLTIPAERTDR